MSSGSQRGVPTTSTALRRVKDLRASEDSGRGRDDGDRRAAGELSREEIFDVLSNERRRHALHYLKRHEDEAIALGDLVEYVAARENDSSVEAVDYKQRKRVYSAMRQTHLPKLDACGLVEYDEQRGVVRPAGVDRDVRMHLEYVPENDIPWCLHYAGLSALLGGVVLLAYVGVFPFDELSGLVFSSITVAAFAVSAAVHTAYTRRNELGAGEPSEQ